jgi:hypothetical protein
MRRLGIRWVRLAYNWVDDARRARPDLDDPAWLDSADFELWVDAFRAHDIEVLGVVFGTARWASSQPDDDRVDNNRITYPRWGLVAPADPADWQRFVQTLAGVRARACLGALERARHLLLLALERGQFAALLRHVSRGPCCRSCGARRPQLRRPGHAGISGVQERVLALAGAEIVFGWHYSSLELVAAARRGCADAVGPRCGAEAYGAPAS